MPYLFQQHIEPRQILFTRRYWALSLPKRSSNSGVQKTMIFFKIKSWFFVFFGFIGFFGFWFFNLKKEEMQYAYIAYCSAFINTKLL